MIFYGISIFDDFDESLIRGLNFYYSVLPVRYGDKISSVLELNLKNGNSEKLQGEIEPGLGSLRIHIEGPISKDWYL